MKDTTQPDLSPKTQHDQPNTGKVDKAQQTDATMRERDIARGAEGTTRRASGPR
ncbi:MAG: hypothetical protein NTX28_17925 [Novosphingobium sp.]|nr:hypothetical protein [Novosphingobium sp.]